MVTADVTVVGGGPAGLAAAIAAAAQGLSVIVLEQRAEAPDKACGEGILPPGVSALEGLGVLPYLPRDDVRCFTGVRFIQEDGTAADVPLPAGGGLGIRRTVLVDAMARRARDAGVAMHHHCAVSALERRGTTAVLATSRGLVEARIVVAADGLHSRLRRMAALDGPVARHRRFALRRHFAVRPWTDFVEVHVDALGEAYVTPVSDHVVNVNVVWEDGAVERPSLETLLRRFPRLAARLDGAEPVSAVCGAGPMACGVAGRTADRLVLVGDAGGFVDSISADGLSMAFNAALLLGPLLPGVLARGATARSLRAYERGAAQMFRRYWAVTNGLLWLARHPGVRRPLIRYVGRHRRMCEAMMTTAMRLMVSPTPGR
jgi:flavin-dependent dehydrogenase